MEKNILYIAIVLDGDSQAFLKSLYERIHNLLPEKTFTNSKMFCHHMTLIFSPKDDEIGNTIYTWAKEKIEGNKPVNLVVDGIGFSNKAIAARVSFDKNIPCANAHRHITMATNVDNNGKPVDSNYIEEWHYVDKTLLNGYVKIIYRN